MSLPKRDGVHDRYYLIHKPDTSPEVLAEADICIQDVLNGTARENHSAYPTVVRNHNGTPFLPDQLLERYLTSLPLKGFPNEDAVFLCDAMRRLVGWQEIRYTLEKYIEKQVQERYFEAGEKEDDFTPYHNVDIILISQIYGIKMISQGQKIKISNTLTEKGQP